MGRLGVGWGGLLRMQYGQCYGFPMFDFFLIPSDASEIDKASQLQNIFFAADILLVLLAAIAGSFVYYYGNKVIEAVKIDAQARFQSAVQRTEEIRSANLKLGLELEKERLARLELERRLAPRFIQTKNDRS